MAALFTALDTLRSCLETALAERPNPPAETCLRVGTETPLSAGLSQNECCSGLAWVRVESITPVVLDGANGTLDDTDNPCSRTNFEAVVEIGVARCAPWGTQEAGPTCEQWTELALLIDNDASAMRQAVCCLKDTLDDYGAVYDALPDQWTPLATEGGCAGGMMNVRIRFDCSDC